MMSETTTEFHSFPEDLFCNILLRLPAKSIVRFKCVSKLWFSITVDPSFLLEHAHSTPDCILIQTHRSEVGDCNVYLQLLPPDTAALFPDRRRNATDRVVASCDGLLCLLDNHFKLGIRYYYVLNPLTGARIYVPNTTWTAYSQVMGLYFNSSTHEYCLIKITASISALDEVQVTSLNGGTWRTFDSLPFRALASFRSPINLNGILYWFACIDMKFRILGFDIMKEEFKLIALPSEDPSVFIRCDLINMRHRLGFVIVNLELSSVGEIEIDIWIMEDYEHVQWPKMYSLRCCAFNDIDFQFEYWAIESALYIKEEEIVILFSGSRSYLLQFDLKVKKYWLLQTLPFGELIERSCFLYKKSLVSPNFFLRDE